MQHRTRSIISFNLAQSWPLSVSGNPLRHSLQVHLPSHWIMASVASLCAIYPSLKMNFQTCLISASRFTWSSHLCLSLNSLDRSLHVCMIMGLQGDFKSNSIIVSICSCDRAPVPSAAQLAVSVYIHKDRQITHIILSCSKSSCDCYKHQYERENCLRLWHPKNHCCENTTPSL